MAAAVFESLSVDPATFEHLTGWSMRPEGLCRGERCVLCALEVRSAKTRTSTRPFPGARRTQRSPRQSPSGLIDQPVRCSKVAGSTESDSKMAVAMRAGLGYRVRDHDPERGGVAW